MAVKDVMTKDFEAIPRDTSIWEAAQKMKALDCGFLPVADTRKDKLCGVVTDRDITLRAVAQGMNPEDTPVEKIVSNKVLYCFEDDPLENASNSMRDLGVYRLVVLNNPEQKRLCGIISLGDIVRSGQSALAKEASEGILNKQQAA